MELNTIRGQAFLAFEIIKKADAGYLHRYVDGLKSCRGRKHGEELYAPRQCAQY